MARNVEIKARLSDINNQRRLARALADQGPEIIRQRDVFFDVISGRLKLRHFGDGTAQMIGYQRADQAEPATSKYALFPTNRPDELEAGLRLCLPILGVIEKERELYLKGRTRIHLDTVKGLGEFVELEVVLADDEDPEGGVEEAKSLMESLQIRSVDLEECAYIDLLLRKYGGC